MSYEEIGRTIENDIARYWSVDSKLITWRKSWDNVEKMVAHFRWKTCLGNWLEKLKFGTAITAFDTLRANCLKYTYSVVQLTCIC